MNDFEQCLNRLQFDLISLLVNFSYEFGQVPYISVYKSRNLSQNKILHRQFVLYTGNTLREEIIPKAS